MYPIPGRLPPPPTQLHNRREAITARREGAYLDVHMPAPAIMPFHLHPEAALHLDWVNSKAHLAEDEPVLSTLAVAQPPSTHAHSPLHQLCPLPWGQSGQVAARWLPQDTAIELDHRLKYSHLLDAPGSGSPNTLLLQLTPSVCICDTCVSPAP